MGSSKSSSGVTSPSTVKAPQQSYQDQGSVQGTSSGYTFGPKTDGSGRSATSYFSEAKAPDTESFGRPTSMVGEVRKAGSELFGQALGVDQVSPEEDATKLPGVSTSRMAGDILKGFTDKLAGEIDPTKGMTDETESLRYGIGGTAKKPEGAYTSSAAAPLM